MLHPWPGNPLWEQKSTLDWASVINGAQRAGALWEAQTPTACGGQARSTGPAETQYRGGSLKDL